MDIREEKLEVKKNAKYIRCLILITLTPELRLDKKKPRIHKL
jgi:hypothetical protein